MPCLKPGVEIGAALIDGEGLVVGEIVGVTHEGVDRADGVALVRGQRNEGVVEIPGFFPGDFATDSIGLETDGVTPLSPPQFRARFRPRNLPVRARRSSAALRDLEMAGRLLSTL